MMPTIQRKCTIPAPEITFDIMDLTQKDMYIMKKVFREAAKNRGLFMRMEDQDRMNQMYANMSKAYPGFKI